MAHRRERLVESPPKAERAVANGNLWRDRKASRLQIDEQFLPALRALTQTRLKAEQLLLALGRRADQHQHAFGLRFHARLQVNAVGPDINITPSRQIAPLPELVFVFPFAFQPSDHGGRKIGRVLAEQGRQHFLEIARRDPAQVKRRQENI